MSNYTKEEKAFMEVRELDYLPMEQHMYFLTTNTFNEIYESIGEIMKSGFVVTQVIHNKTHTVERGNTYEAIVFTTYIGEAQEI